jgi:hypothetical protein
VCVILERATPDLIRGSAFGDPTLESSKTPYLLKSLRHFLFWIPALARASLSPREDDGSIRIRNFFTGSEAGSQATYPLGIVEILQEAEPPLRCDLGARLSAGLTDQDKCTFG